MSKSNQPGPIGIGGLKYHFDPVLHGRLVRAITAGAAVAVKGLDSAKAYLVYAHSDGACSAALNAKVATIAALGDAGKDKTEALTAGVKLLGFIANTGTLTVTFTPGAAGPDTKVKDTFGGLGTVLHLVEIDVPESGTAYLDPTVTP